VLRVIGFLVLALVLASLLGHLPLVGVFFRGTGILGLLLSAALLSALFTAGGRRLLGARRVRSEVRRLEAVDSAHNHGKIGTLYLARGRTRAAREHLARAVAGEPQIAEWHYRLGLAELALGEHEAALSALEKCVAIDEEHAYGGAQLRRADCLGRLARPREALAVLALLERNHGPSPESAFRRGRAHAALGERDAARAALREVAELARKAPRYQRARAGLWAFRARLCSLR
jgi:tetratricopeptide (TPR) repeat protein